MLSCRTVGAERMSRPPVMICAMPSATDSVPRVTMSGGTWALATRNPLRMPQKRPTTTATRRPTRATPQPSPPSDSIVLADTTDETTRTEPTDRSMPEVMMTNVIPTAMTAQIETFWATLVRLPVVRNWVGESTPNAPKMTTSTPRIHTDCIDLTRSRMLSCLAEVSIGWAGLVMVLMPPPPSGPGRRSWRRRAVRRTCPPRCRSPRVARGAAPVRGRRPRARAASSAR